MNAETGPFFVDTNILLYAHDRSAGQKHEIARRLVEELWQTRQGCLSLQVLQEFYFNVTQKIPRPLECNLARQIISDLAHWRLHIPGVEDMLQAIDVQQVYQLSFWDAMVLNSAAQLGCKHLFSEDLNHGQVYGEVQVINPFNVPNSAPDSINVV
ncbi:MAG: PIN domain-containing protein [Anaerolineales bacterium]|nr:PIN domain-containing protein [Anaerolineales bacterium]